MRASTGSLPRRLEAFVFALGHRTSSLRSAAARLANQPLLKAPSVYKLMLPSHLKPRIECCALRSPVQFLREAICLPHH